MSNFKESLRLGNVGELIVYEELLRTHDAADIKRLGDKDVGIDLGFDILTKEADGSLICHEVKTDCYVMGSSTFSCGRNSKYETAGLYFDGDEVSRGTGRLFIELISNKTNPGVITRGNKTYLCTEDERETWDGCYSKYKRQDIQQAMRERYSPRLSSVRVRRDVWFVCTAHQLNTRDYSFAPRDAFHNYEQLDGKPFLLRTTMTDLATVVECYMRRINAEILAGKTEAWKHYGWCNPNKHGERVTYGLYLPMTELYSAKPSILYSLTATGLTDELDLYDCTRYMVLPRLRDNGRSYSYAEDVYALSHLPQGWHNAYDTTYDEDIALIRSMGQHVVYKERIHADGTRECITLRPSHRLIWRTYTCRDAATRQRIRASIRRKKRKCI